MAKTFDPLHPSDAKKGGSGKHAPTLKHVHKSLENDPIRQDIFIDSLRQFGAPAWAAKAASPHSKGDCLKTFSDLYKRSAEFRERWDEAVALARDDIMVHARRLASGHYQEIIVQKGAIVCDDDGKPVTKRVFSEKITDTLLKLHFPMPGSKQEINVFHHGTPKGPVFAISPDEAWRLPQEQRLQLMGIVQAIEAIRKAKAVEESKEDQSPAVRMIKNKPDYVDAEFADADSLEDWEKL